MILGRIVRIEDGAIRCVEGKLVNHSYTCKPILTTLCSKVYDLKKDVLIIPADTAWNIYAHSATFVAQREFGFGPVSQKP